MKLCSANPRSVYPKFKKDMPWFPA